MGQIFTFHDAEWGKKLQSISHDREGWEFENVCGEGRLRFSNSASTCQINGIYLPRRVSLLYVESTLQAPLTLKFAQCDPPQLMIIAILIGQAELLPSGSTLPPNAYCLLTASESSPASLKITAKPTCEMVCISLSKTTFLDWISCELKGNPESFLRGWSQESQSTPTFYEVPFGNFARNLLIELFQHPYQGYSRILHLEAQTMEFLANCTQRVRFEQTQIETGKALSPHQMIQLQEARKWILQQLDQDLTIARIARQIGMSVSLLQAGFKEVHGQNIGRFLRQARMKRAARILLNSPATIREIAQQVGYQNHGHFTRRFKEYHGVSPSEFRRKIVLE